MMKKGKRWAMEKGELVAARGRPESTERRKKVEKEVTEMQRYFDTSFCSLQKKS